MNIVKTMLVVLLFFAAGNTQARRKQACAQTPQNCAEQQVCKPKKCGLAPRTRRSNCPPPEYGLDCDSCCYQAYTTPSYYGNAFRPFYGDGYFGRRQGNYNFAW
jgi:hypothetical protein